MYIYRLYMKAEFYCIYCSREFRQPWQIVVPPRVTPGPFSTSMAIGTHKTPASDLFFPACFCYCFIIPFDVSFPFFLSSS